MTHQPSLAKSKTYVTKSPHSYSNIIAKEAKENCSNIKAFGEHANQHY